MIHWFNQKKIMLTNENKALILNGDDVFLLSAPFYKPHSPKFGDSTLGVKANRSAPECIGSKADYLKAELSAEWMRLWRYERGIRLFSHDGKVRILNCDSRCASWIKIRNTVFWTVCTPNHVEICDLRCASQITVQRCFPVTILANHAAKSLCEWLDL